MTTTHPLNGLGSANAELAGSDCVGRLVIVIELVGRPITICSRIPFGHQEVEVLLSHPLVASIILESEDRELVAAFPSRVGFFNGCGSHWQLPEKISSDMIYIGRWNDFGAHAAWLAWRAGISRIHIASELHFPHTHTLFAVVVRKSFRSAWYRLVQSTSPKLLPKILSAGMIFQIEQVRFARKLSVIESRPLPIPGISVSWQPGRIVVVGATLGPGGAERQISTTLEGLFARGHRDLHFLHHWPMRSPNDFFLPTLMRLDIPFSAAGELGRGLKLSSELTQELEQRLAPLGDLGADILIYAKEFLVRRPEIVHVWLDHMNVVAGLAALLVGVPRVLLGCRSMAPVRFSFKQPYMRPIYRLLGRYSNITFLNNSEAGAEDYRHWLGLQPGKIQIIRNGFNFSRLPSIERLAEWRAGYRSRYGIPCDVPVVGVIMRISEEKRPLLWVEIAQRVTKHMPDAHFLIVGNGPMREQVEVAARKALPGNIHFAGHEENTSMALAAMDIFLLTSRVEGLPNVLIEAQAMGVQPVAINVGGAKETMINGETGWLVASSAVSDVASKIVSVLTDKSALSTVSNRARNFVCSQFGLERMINQTLAAYGYANRSEERSLSESVPLHSKVIGGPEYANEVNCRK